ncbi:mitochondrial amidoxime-reducing component 1-like isoform X1 [Daphnia pulex]|uniref:mitochondrial amidoxime-reducing component 1-like isoform X1 n=1 Tax=Daphnia pulex TaxID=6669 RepID=UPI001EE04BA8|nr:mitochondrial amidoxime-reducing component 1-like isoform X1 [Daphnia pulex]XP_046441185.1 mitochondrial amidoxime-reducing component 1-like isoform X2 [Daphnia pulex]XP_046441186.1 mitochondrial amidoxime-reducing component 1-like isoform X1 [Daphnia pulex]XP_046441187.1 mitochondrial amidoxime-reducing component 1-like isoform X1 [Daphnia pulex]
MDQKQKVVLAVGIGAAALLGAAAAYKLYKKSNQMKTSKQLVKGWKACGVVSQLHIFPIKSCHGIEVEEADAQKMGLVSGELQDRSFMVYNESNNFLHARLHPTMVLIKISVSDNKVELTAPNSGPITFSIPSEAETEKQVKVRVWGDEVTAFDCGDQVSQWLSQYIFQKDTGARLAHLSYPEVSPRVVKSKLGHPWMKPKDGGVFSDLTPFHLLSVESANDLNSRVDGLEISTSHFRPTITISGCQRPYEEDDWRFVRIGEQAIFRYVKGCDRCVLTTIDPATGIKDPDLEPLRTLRKYRLAEDPVLRRAIGESPLLGINLSLEQSGRIRKGDVVYVGQL